MPLVNIDPDVDAFLQAMKRATGLDASAVFRQAVGLPEPGLAQLGSMTGPSADSRSESLKEFITGQSFQRGADSRDATTRFLGLLGHLAAANPDRFRGVLELGGRRRRYFATDEMTIRRSGRHLAPKPIAGTPYWVMTNASTDSKAQIIDRVMRLLEYAPADRVAARQALQGLSATAVSVPPVNMARFQTASEAT